MSNLKSVKNRISGIKSTQKITRAMYMVAASKVKKAENAVRSSRPFTLQLYDIFNKLYKEAQDENITEANSKKGFENYPELLKIREQKTAALVIINANKGLAGSYCANIVRYSTNMIKKLSLEGKNIKIYFVGTKAIPPIKSIQKQYKFEIDETYSNLINDINSTSSYLIATALADEYIKGDIDVIHLITTRYKNMMTYSTESWQMLPLITDNEKIRMFRKQELDEELDINYDKHHIEPLSEYIPDFNSLLSMVVPMYMTNVVYQALLEANASELASRMTAMNSATNNANDMISALMVEYNKVRQANITNEITEVISGANAIN